ncbi:putative secreted protein (Por secretion system target) [Mucilaginibacter gracilis]|uniref:Putative secreted protein (Por secretion system target) n=1 Tax=Mucilaginibacter gracilis TaxID=423350 RepID=A0A495IW37_9SPHI|nr:T9SS type A sorting domain-containing protein [Mucilaginibacter gracilis]RKR80713.1 putative secreted protein (Por secretion system target) [Mucilaginibacter gracilis]
MKRLLTSLSLCFTILFLQVSLNAQTYKWVKGGGTSQDLSSAYSDEEMDHMCTDANGNVYGIGIVGNNAIIADTFHRPSGAYGAPNNIFVVSYNCSGQMRWAKLIGSTSTNNENYGITTDNSGHVYIAGSFPHSGPTHTLYIGYDTSFATFPYSTLGVIQLDTLGAFNWIRFVGPSTFASISAFAGQSNPIVMDGSDNVHFICGSVGVGIPLSSSVSSHYGVYDLTYDASGTLLSATQLLQDTTLEVDGAAIDKSTGKLYVHGTRSAPFYLTSSPMSYHPYIAAFDVSRNLIWTDTLSNPLIVDAAAFASIVSDDIGHLYVTCGGNGKLVYKHDTSSNTMSTSPYFFSVMMKLDTAGNLRWKKAYSGTSDINFLNAITLLPNNKIASAGTIAGTIASGGDTITSYSGEGHNCYFTILDTAGYVHTIQQIHGTGFYDDAYAITADKKGSLYIGGAIVNNVWGGSLSPYTSVGGNTDYFIMKYGVDCSCTTLPVANYTQVGAATRVFTYTGTTASIDSVRWEFGDGGTSTALSPTHTYSSPGIFTACVTVYTACGSDTHCSDITIVCAGAPTAAYTTTGTGLTQTFTYTGTGLGTAGTISWTFGDGTPASSATPVSHTFSAAGTYVICLAATNSCGTTTSCNVMVVTCTTPPVSAFTFTGIGASRSFTYSGTTAGLDSVTWTFGDGGTATGLTASHTYVAPGAYTACATVHTNCGTNTHCNTIVITCTTAPVAAFTSSGTGATISFNYSGTTAALDSVRWDFADGGTSTSTTPSHTYATTGTFHVCVTAYTACGHSTICHDVIITCITTVTAAFTDTGNAVHGFAFTGTTAGLDSVVWDYGDGHRDTGMARLHTFAHSGTYHVCVTVYTDCGNNLVCRDIVVAHTTGVETLSLADIKVYPNPATNELSVTGIPGTTAYRILTVTGINLQTGALQTGGNIIPLPNISAGIYLLEMTGPTGEKNTMRFIKG